MRRSIVNFKKLFGDKEAAPPKKSENSESETNTERIFTDNCVKAPSMTRQKTGKKGIDADLMINKLAERGYNVSANNVFDITQGDKDSGNDEDDFFSNYVSKDEFDQIVTNLRRKRDAKNETKKIKFEDQQGIYLKYKRSGSINVLKDILDIAENDADEMIKNAAESLPQ